MNYKTATLSAAALEQLQSMEQRLSSLAGSPLILVAYEPEEQPRKEERDRSR